MSELTEMADQIGRYHTGGIAGLTADQVPEILHRGYDVLKRSASGVPITANPARPMLPIGLSGFAGAGKTEAAKFIESRFGYQRQHIAEPLRRMLASLMREYGYRDETIQRFLVGDLKESPVPEFGVTSRHLQITLGTEWGREQVDQGIWAKLWSHQAAVSQMSGGPAAMNDSVRFPNEEAAIRATGGVTILITRPGTGPAAYRWKRLGPVLYRWFGCMWGVHDSERVDRLTPDHVIVNDGTLDDLRQRITDVLATS